MNVLIAADYKAPNSGNFIASLIELAHTLENNGDKAFFVFPKCENTEKNNSWVQWILQEGFLVKLIDMQKSDEEILSILLSEISLNSIDILHLHFGIFHRVIIRNRKKLKHIKILIHDHMDFGVEESIIKQKLRTAVRSLGYRLLRINVISVMAAKHKSYLFCNKKWFVPNGLSLKRNIQVSESRARCRERLGIGQNDKLCLFLGWDLRRKGLDIAVKAVNILREKFPELYLAVVGIGEGMPSERTVTYIEKYTDIPATSPWIKYLPSTEDMYAYHRAADIYLSASRKEAFSYGILEAISQNTPVVVSNIEGTRWASEYENSIFYEVENEYDCATAMENAFKQGRTPSNFKEIVNNYSIEKWCNRIVEIYKIIK